LLVFVVAKIIFMFNIKALLNALVTY
jgi:hypothetical protein